MLILLSPAKTLDFSSIDVTKNSIPEFLEQTQTLVDDLKGKSTEELTALMGVSAKIAELNVDRFHSYSAPKKSGPEVKQALFAFKGDVYKDWPLNEYSAEDLDFAQEHLRILSGLYGMLRPLDLIRAYRLEMGTPLQTDQGKGLYKFWGTQLTDRLNAAMKSMNEPFIVNLASNEYFKAVQPKSLQAPVIAPVFKDWKNGKYKIISFFAKRARGAMADYLLRSRITTVDGIKGFTGMGYQYAPDGSTNENPLFLRRQE